MSEPGLYALTKILAGGISAVMTGPLGTTDLPDVDIRAALGGQQAAYAAKISSQDGTVFGYTGHDRKGSPKIHDLPDRFVQALLSIEDAHFGSHPGVDPVAVVSAGIDTLRGNRRGGSTLTQQLVKNAVTGPDLTLDRKVREAILAVRVQHAFSSEEIIQGYLSNAWFGRSQEGAAGASLAWFGKPWAEIKLHEAAFLAGILKGPSYYDPVKYPERSLERRNLVLTMMHSRKMITPTELEVAKAQPLEVISNEEARALFENVPHWTASGISSDIERYGLMNRSDIARGSLEITTTIDPDWQELAQLALDAGVSRVGNPGAAYRVDLPVLEHGSDLSGGEMNRIRNRAATGLVTTRTSGRAIISSVKDGKISTIIDRGFGELEWDWIDLNKDVLGFTPKRGDVLPYKRVDDIAVLQPTPQVQGAVVVMDPETGAVLASVGGSDADLFPFDRTQAFRQPGSSLKPFLWARAMEEGMRYDDMVEDIERTYYTRSGEKWRPKNYDRSQSGLIPLFVGLEESSNLVAASLGDKIGVDALAQITEVAGVYDWGKMRRHETSALGVSETTLTRMAAGYSAFANGGLVVTPHHIAGIDREGKSLWTPRGPEDGYAMATYQTTTDISSMLYGVTKRGTAYSAFKGLKVPVAGKTGTTQDYRDAWFMSYTPGVVIGVWVGRDDFKPIPGNLSGSRAAAPIARSIYQGAVDKGILLETGYRKDQEEIMPWPPRLLTAGQSRTRQLALPVASDPFKRSVPEVILDRNDSRVSARNIDDINSVLSNVSPSGDDAWFDKQPAGGYLDAPNAQDEIFPDDSKRSSETDLIFRSPW